MPKPETTAFALVALCYAVLLGAGWVWPDSFLWGVHSLAFLPAFLSVTLVIVALLLALPPLADRYMPWLELIAGVWNVKRSKRIAFCMAAGVVSAGIFFLFRNQLTMYGDERTLLTVLGSKTYTIAGVFRLEDYAPLTRLLHQQVASLTGLDQRTAIAATSAAVGGSVVGLLIWFAASLDAPRDWKILFLIVGIGSGATQLFFGYVEDYTLVYGCMMIFFMLGWRFFDGGRGFGWMAVTYAVGLTLHIEMVLLTPALLYAAAVAIGRRGRPIGAGRVLALVLVSLLLALGAYLYIFRASEFSGTGDQERITKIFLPLRNYLPEPHRYTLLSMGHLSDVFQEFLLVVSPGAVLMLLLSVFGGGSKRWREPMVMFFALGALYVFVFDCTVNPLLTPMRDWDFLSLISAPVAFLALALSRGLFTGAAQGALARRITGFALGALILPVSFVAVNARTESGAARLRSLGEWAFESYYIGSAYMINAGCLMMPDLRAQSVERMAIIHRIEGDASAPDVELGILDYKCAVTLYAVQEYDGAITYFRRALAQDSLNASALQGMALSLLLQGNVAAADAAIAPIRAALALGELSDPLSARIAGDITQCARLAAHPEDSLAASESLQDARLIQLK